MKKTYFGVVLSVVLAATLCFTTVFALPVWAEGTDGAVQGPVAVGETVNSSAENPAPQTEPTVESNGQLEALSHVVEDVQDQLNKVKMEAVLAVGFGFVALVLSVIALLMSLRKTVSAGSNAQGSNDSAEWKKLNQNIQQIEQQLQKLAQKQEKALETARSYTPTPTATATVPNLEFTMPAVQQPNTYVMKQSPTAEPHLVQKEQKPRAERYLVYEKDYQNNLVPVLKDAPGAEKIQMRVLSDGTVIVDERKMQSNYERAQNLSDAGLNRVFDIVMEGQTIPPQKLSNLGSLKLKKMRSAAHIESAQDGIRVVSRGSLEFEQQDYS